MYEEENRPSVYRRKAGVSIPVRPVYIRPVSHRSLDSVFFIHDSKCKSRVCTESAWEVTNVRQQTPADILKVSFRDRRHKAQISWRFHRRFVTSSNTNLGFPKLCWKAHWYFRTPIIRPTSVVPQLLFSGLNQYLSRNACYIVIIIHMQVLPFLKNIFQCLSGFFLNYWNRCCWVSGWLHWIADFSAVRKPAGKYGKK